jgi:type VI secretion system protein ImpG
MTMNDPLAPYYESELAFVQEFARQFARQFPAEAGRLLPDPTLTLDPHAERFIEGFALLAGRIRYKIGSEFPELTDTLLGVLYPHLVAPVPSMAVAQFEPAAERPPPAAGAPVARGTALHTRPLGKPPQPCRWRTGYPVTLWPVRLTEARLLPPPFPPGLEAPPRTAGALTLRFECLGGAQFRDLELDRLRLYLSGEGQMIASLYEFLFNHTTSVLFRDPEPGARRAVRLPPAACLGQVGLGLDEGLLPWPVESFVGYLLLTELFSFPDKFLFVDLCGWPQVRRAGFGRQAEVTLFLSRSQPNVQQGVNARTFLLGCTPVVNLFEQSAEPVALTQTRTEYRLVPSRLTPLGTEVYSVDAVTCLDPTRREPVEMQPFYSFTYDQTRDNRHAFWYAARRPSPVDGDRGTEVYLTVVDREFDPRLPAEAMLDVRTTCTNRDVPLRFQHAGEELFPEGFGAELPGTARCLHIPTPSLRPPLRRAAYWRLVAQNSLNHVALSDPRDGRAALQEILRLCDFTDPAAGQQQQAAVNRQMIEGITGLLARRVLGRARDRGRFGACRGIAFTLELDEQRYVGTGPLLFASVLERFLGLYAAINSFSQLTARTRQGELKRWPPRAAEEALL